MKEKNFYAYMVSMLLLAMLLYLPSVTVAPAFIAIITLFITLFIFMFYGLSRFRYTMQMPMKYMLICIVALVFLIFASFRALDVPGALVLSKYVALFIGVACIAILNKRYDFLHNVRFIILTRIILIVFYMVSIWLLIHYKATSMGNVISCATFLLLPLCYLAFGKSSYFLSLVVIYLSQARAVLIAILLFPVFYLLFKLLKDHNKWKVLLFILLLVLLACSLFFYLNMGDEFKTLINTISIRYFHIVKSWSPIRQSIYQGIIKHVGYYSIAGDGLSASVYDLLHLKLSAHNQFISVYFRLGYVGLILFVALLYLIFILNINNAFLLAYISSTMLIAFTEVILLGNQLSLNFFFWVMVMCAPEFLIQDRQKK